MSPQAIFEAAAGLPEKARLELATRLLETLGPESEEIDEAAFVAELERRSTEIDQGKAELISWSDLKGESA